MNNPLQPTPDATEMRLPLTLVCTSNEYDEDALINYVELVSEEDGVTDALHRVTLPVPQEMAALFEAGKEYQVEVKVTIPDRAFTPFRPFGNDLGQAV